MTSKSQTLSQTSPQVSEDLDPRTVTRSPFRALLTNSAFLVLFVNIILVAGFTAFSRNGVFFTVDNLESLLRISAEMLILALGVTLLMSAGVFDLSVGANLVLSSVISGLSINWLVASGVDNTTAILVGCVVAIVVGATFGMINGAVITKLKVNSLIATLGTMGVGLGVAQLLTNGQDVRGLPTSIQEFALSKFGVMPAPTLTALALLLAGWALLRYTRFGMRTLAIGSNPTAASRSGIAVDRHIILLTCVAGGLSGFAGFVDISRFGATTMASHSLDGLAAVTAVVIGGTALSGGRASVMGTLWGTALSIILLSGLIIIRVQPYWQLVVTGIVLVAAVAFDQFRARHLE